MADKKHEERKGEDTSWQSARSETWARGDKDMNPRPANQQNKHPTHTGEPGGEVRTQPGDTPAMVARRKQLQRREPGQSLVGNEPATGFQVDE